MKSLPDGADGHSKPTNINEAEYKISASNQTQSHKAKRFQKIVPSHYTMSVIKTNSISCPMLTIAWLARFGCQNWKFQ